MPHGRAAALTVAPFFGDYRASIVADLYSAEMLKYARRPASHQGRELLQAEWFLRSVFTAQQAIHGHSRTRCVTLSDMPVEVESGFDLTMAENIRDNLGTNPLAKQQGRAGMPQVMNAKDWQTSRSEQAVEVFAERAL
jgi:hypothetical protein